MLQTPNLEEGEAVGGRAWYHSKERWVEYTYGTPMSVLPSFAERKRVWVFRRCTLSEYLSYVHVT